MPHNLKPTGNCFQDSIDFVNACIASEIDASINYVVVHAMIIGSSGERHSHSWVEHAVTGEVWTAGINQDGQRDWASVRDRSAFYEWLEATDITRYTIDEVQALYTSTGHGPPWEARYHVLCADQQLQPTI